MAAVVPRSVLEQRDLIAKFSLLIDPVVRAVDKYVGGTTSMRVDVKGKDGSSVSVIYSHDELSECVGIAAASFTWYLLSHETLPSGVKYPEELLSEEDDREELLSHAIRGAFSWETRVKR